MRLEGLGIADAARQVLDFVPSRVRA
jgi:hypothetical protein